MRKLDDLITDLAAVERIENLLEREWRLIEVRKRHKLTIGEFKRLRSLIKAQSEGEVTE